MRKKLITPMQRARARRRLINRLTPRLQLHLFEDRSKDTALAFAELKAGLDKFSTRAERKA
jgi:hypothetical protein